MVIPNVSECIKSSDAAKCLHCGWSHCYQSTEAVTALFLKDSSQIIQIAKVTEELLTKASGLRLNPINPATNQDHMKSWRNKPFLQTKHQLSVLKQFGLCCAQFISIIRLADRQASVIILCTVLEELQYQCKQRSGQHV